jgi:uncharacterized phage protein gp47/JayE
LAGTTPLASLTPLTDDQWDALIAQAYAAACERYGLPVATLGTGSQLAAIFYAERAALMQQSGQLQYGVYISRLANCVGSDVDSYVAQFGITRLSATYATGQVICTTNSPVTIPIVVPVGAQFGTDDGLVYVVVADPSNEAYSQSSGGYVISPTGSSTPSTVSVTVQCTTPGTIGNAQPNQITLFILGPINTIGIGSVNNTATVAGAIDTESDAALKARFQATFAGGSDGGTPLEILALVLGLEANLTVSVADNNNAGTADDGWYTVVVNTIGATVATPEQLLQAVQAAVLENNTAGTSFVVMGSTVTDVNITAVLTLKSGADAVATPELAVAALQAYIDSIGLSPTGGTTTLSIAQIYFAIINASSDILDVTSLSVNGGAVDLTAAFAVQFAPGSITLSVA